MRQAEEIAQDIWALAGQEISCACPFFALSCASFENAADKKTGGAGTDGCCLYYEPKWTLETFQKGGQKAVNRVYLHTLFHCLYLHPALSQEKEEYREDVWNLACDIVAEYTVNYLKLPGLTGEPDEEKQEIYKEFWDGKKSRTAGELYEIICSSSISDARIRYLRSLFLTDEHHLWKSLTAKEMQEMKSKWQKIISRTSQDAGEAGKRAGSQRGHGEEWYLVQQKRRYDYRKFLRRFAVQREEIQLDMESFDYISYCLGLRIYGNMPLVEPLEYTEAARLEELVIAIDTSSSCSRKTVQRFLEETYSMLSSRANFFRKMNVHIIQCDCYIQEDVLITCEEEWKAYLKEIRIQGRGGTDFRPVFVHVNRLIAEKKIRNLKGLLYFTDGDGIYPASPPDYETAFIFESEPKEGVRVPSWALTLYLDEKERQGG